MHDKLQVKQIGRRRVNGFFYGLLLVAIFNTVFEESDITSHVADDVADIVLAAVGLLLILAWRKRTSISDLRKINNILAVLAVLVVVATIYAITQEYTDPMDFGNEIPTLIFGIFLLINRFI